MDIRATSASPKGHRSHRQCRSRRRHGYRRVRRTTRLVHPHASLFRTKTSPNTLTATAKGAKILFRTGAAFVSARLGIDPIAPITASDLNLDPRVGGLILAGSYVPKTTAQLESLTRNGGTHLATVVLDVETLLHSEAQRDEAITNALRECETALRVPRDVLVMTSRKLVTGSDSASSLDIGNVVAKALVAFVQRLDVRPRYLIAKASLLSSRPMHTSTLT